MCVGQKLKSDKRKILKLYYLFDLFWTWNGMKNGSQKQLTTRQSQLLPTLAEFWCPADRTQIRKSSVSRGSWSAEGIMDWISGAIAMKSHEKSPFFGLAMSQNLVAS